MSFKKLDSSGRGGGGAGVGSEGADAAPKPSAKTNPNPTKIPTSASIVELPDEDEEIFYDAIG
ncbi:hypothetical protein BDR04DRAFT_1164208 [Suillus decipiens]|nr:hypothetical protein BDR04DRAFT_1164208 [Suillus decipiens]